jgi:hypothetical protein
MNYINLHLKIGERRLPAPCTVQAALRARLLEEPSELVTKNLLVPPCEVFDST